jgi:hypothetical protein
MKRYAVVLSSILYWFNCGFWFQHCVFVRRSAARRRLAWVVTRSLDGSSAPVQDGHCGLRDNIAARDPAGMGDLAFAGPASPTMLFPATQHDLPTGRCSNHAAFTTHAFWSAGV